MSHIDTLKAYEELVESGVDAKQAKAQVHTLNSSFDRISTKDDLNILEKDINISLIEIREQIKLLNMKLNITIGVGVFAFTSMLGIQGYILKMIFDLASK